MKGRRLNNEENFNSITKKLTVSPFTPGSPVNLKYCLYKKENNFLYIPKFFNEQGELIENNLFYCNIPINARPREYQIDPIKIIFNEIKKNTSCIACLYTGWGKTFAAIYIAHLLGLKTLIIVNKESLLNQWKEEIIKFTGITPGIIQGTITDNSKEITIGMIQSISMKKYSPEIFSEFSFTVYDETHHYCSKIFSNVFYKIGSKYNLGLTATLKRADKLEHTLEWFLGKPIVNIKLLIIKPIVQIIEHYLSFNIIKCLPNGKINSPSTITALCNCDDRNNIIINKIKELNNYNRKILVLSDRKQQCIHFYNNLKGYSVGIYFGGMKSEELKKTNECEIILATYQMASEGYDNPKLDTLIMASPKKEIEQACGRILRKKNKNDPLIIDFHDCISIFNNWNRQRLNFYNKNKFIVNYFEEKVKTEILTECLL